MSETHDGSNRASVTERLRVLAQERGESFQSVLAQYSQERFLYRLGQSSHGRAFVLRGALLLKVWFGTSGRATQDVDLLCVEPRAPEHLAKVFTEVVTMEANLTTHEEITFVPGSIRAVPNQVTARLPSMEIRLVAQLGSLMVPIRCTVGFGDWVSPDAAIAPIPVLLPGSPPPTLAVYRKETFTAEKLATLVTLARYNTRMQDFYDLYFLFVRGFMHQPSLQAAVRTTFLGRQLALPTELPTGLSDSFATEKQGMWQAFVHRSALRAPEFGDVIQRLRKECWPTLLNPRLKHPRGR